MQFDLKNFNLKFNSFLENLLLIDLENDWLEQCNWEIWPNWYYHGSKCKVTSSRCKCYNGIAPCIKHMFAMPLLRQNMFAMPLLRWPSHNFDEKSLWHYVKHVMAIYTVENYMINLAVLNSPLWCWISILTAIAMNFIYMETLLFSANILTVLQMENS